MGLKTIHSVSGEISTTDSTFTTIATYTVPADCSIRITEIFAIGRTTNGTVGETAYAEATYRAKRVAGVLTLIGSIVFITTFNTGSDTAVRTSSLQLLISGSNILLQVRGIGGGSPRNMDWYGGFTVTLN